MIFRALFLLNLFLLVACQSKTQSSFFEKQYFALDSQKKEQPICVIETCQKLQEDRFGLSTDQKLDLLFLAMDVERYVYEREAKFKSSYLMLESMKDLSQAQMKRVAFEKAHYHENFYKSIRKIIPKVNFKNLSFKDAVHEFQKLTSISIKHDAYLAFDNEIAETESSGYNLEFYNIPVEELLKYFCDQGGLKYKLLPDERTIWLEEKGACTNCCGFEHIKLSTYMPRIVATQIEYMESLSIREINKLGKVMNLNRIKDDDFNTEDDDFGGMEDFFEDEKLFNSKELALNSLFDKKSPLGGLNRLRYDEGSYSLSVLRPYYRVENFIKSLQLDPIPYSIRVIEVEKGYDGFSLLSDPFVELMNGEKLKAVFSRSSKIADIDELSLSGLFDWKMSFEYDWRKEELYFDSRFKDVKGEGQTNRLSVKKGRKVIPFKGKSGETLYFILDINPIFSW